MRIGTVLGRPSLVSLAKHSTVGIANEPPNGQRPSDQRLIFHHRERCTSRQTCPPARSAKITVSLNSSEGSLVPSSRTSSRPAHRGVPSPALPRCNSTQCCD